MARQTIPRKWCPYATAAQQYIGISPNVLLAAIKAHELKAFEKPKTYDRKPDATRENHSYFVNLDEVDEYIRTHWPEAFPL